MLGIVVQPSMTISIGIVCGASMIKVLCAMAAVVAMTTTLSAADLAVFSGGAPEAALRTLGPQFEKSSGHKVTFTFAIVTALQKRLIAGEKADLIFLPVPLIAEVEKAVPMRKEGRGPLARVGLAVVVREGTPVPDVSTTDSLKKVLLAAKSIALSEASTPGGSYVLRMLQKMGIADELKGRLVMRGAINGGGDLIAKGEADVGLYLMSEMRAVRGVVVAGLLPPELRFFVGYGTAIPASNSQPEPALALIKFLTSTEQAPQWRQAGFELGGPLGK